MIWLLGALGAYLVVLCAIAWFSLRPFRTPLYISPGSLGAPQRELVIPSTGGVRLSAWWVEAPGAKTVAILCHGYVMNRSEWTPLAHWLWQRGVSSLLFEFRAHGRTKGGHSTIGVREADDVAAAVAEARRLAPDARILLIGSSMGSAACAFAAADGAPVDALVLDSCYSTLVSASFGWWRFLGGPVLSWVLGPTVLLAAPFAGINPFKVDVAKALNGLPHPVLILHGRADNLALPSQAERNLASLGGRGEVVWFEGCGHAEFRWNQPEAFMEALESFLVRHGFVGAGESRSELEPQARVRSLP